MAARYRPAVAVVDVKMPGGGAVAVSGIRRVCPEARILAFTAHADRSTVLAMVGAGATGYLLKGASAERILQGIHETSLGLASLSGEVAAEVVGELADKIVTDMAQTTARRAPLRRVQQLLSEARLHLEYQPIVDLQDGRIAGVEALLRIDAEPHQPPDAWLAEAAAAGLQVDLEVAALKLAIEQRAGLPAEAYLSVNLSPFTLLQPDAEALLRSVADRRLVVEITEHAPVTDYQVIADALAPLRSLGVRLAVDDAGSGFASLRHIVQLEPDIIKIDISLARNIHLDPTRRALAAALITFAEEIDASVVVEGIESEAELSCLRGLGARYGQGFLLGRPTLPSLLDFARPVAALAGRPASLTQLGGLAEKLALIKLLHTTIDAGLTRSVDQALQVALDGVCAQTSWPVGHAWLASDNGGLVSSGVWHLDGMPELRTLRDGIAALPREAAHGLPARVLASGEPRLAMLPEGGEGELLPASARMAGLVASLAVPVSVGSRVLGVLEFWCWDAVLPSRSLLDVLASFGQQLGIVLERLRARQDREQRELQLRQAQQLANLGSWEWWPSSGVARFSVELSRILGWTPGGWAPGDTTTLSERAFSSLNELIERVHPDDRSALSGAIRSALGGAVVELEYRVRRPDGERVIQGRIGSMGGDGGGPVVIGTAQDVTDRRRAEQEFAHQVIRLRLVLESIVEGVVVADAAGHVVEANPAAIAMLGLPRRPRPGEPVDLGRVAPAFLPDMVTPFPADQLPLMAAVAGQAVEHVVMYVRPASRPGDGLWVSVNARPLIDRDGRQAGGVIIFAEMSGPPAGFVGAPQPAERTHGA